MSQVDFDLHALRERDLPTLEALRRALELVGESAAVSVASEIASSERAPLPAGPIPCRVRVHLEGTESATGSSAEARVVIEDRALPPEDLGTPSEVLMSADLVLVPGPAHAVRLAEKCRGEVIATGLARLDTLLREPAEDPSGSMNASAAILRTIEWAAAGPAPSLPASSVAAENAQTSSDIWIATGKPNLTMRSSARGSNACRFHGCQAP